MKESNTLADNVAISQLQKVIWLSIKGLCMKESNTLVDNVAIRQLQREILLGTKKLCMKESTLHCCFQTRQISNVTRKFCHTSKLFFKLNCIKKIFYCLCLCYTLPYICTQCTLYTCLIPFPILTGYCCLLCQVSNSANIILYCHNWPNLKNLRSFNLYFGPTP